VNRGWLYLEKLGDTENAMRDLAQAIGLDPDHSGTVKVYKMLGKIHFGEKRYEQAIDVPESGAPCQPRQISCA
jgi:hypothetical protein